MTGISESVVEDAALGWLAKMGWVVVHGPDIAPGAEAAERTGYGEVVLRQRLRDALARLNSGLPATARDDAFRKLTRPEGATLEARNRAVHRLLVDGVTVEYRSDDGSIRGAQAQPIDFDRPAGNDWLAVNQFTVVENEHERRPDIVLFVNGLPLGVIELKNPADEQATLRSAYRQLQTYRNEIPALFAFNAVLVVSDGAAARIGTLTAGWEWFKPWRTISGEALAEAHLPQLQVLLEGVCEPRRFLALLRDFIVFEDGGGAPAKKMAGYHQFHAVEAAVGQTLRAAELLQAAELQRVAESRRTAGSRHAAELQRVAESRRTAGQRHTAEQRRTAGQQQASESQRSDELQEVAESRRTAGSRHAAGSQRVAESKRPAGSQHAAESQHTAGQHTAGPHEVAEERGRYEYDRSPGAAAGEQRESRYEFDSEPAALGVRRQSRFEFAGEPGGAPGDRRIGVVWHTQGSGKSLTMVFYAGRIVREPAMKNPTVVVLTDRNDLDDQLFGTFSRCAELLRQPPVQADNRADLRAKLAVASGGVVFTTIQKFFPDEKGGRYPQLSDRSNIVVIADEAHRSQYDFIDGYARHMRDALPKASFIGFTGTPIELADASTRAVFGDHISVYDIRRSVEDGATVPIYYESRLAKLALDEREKPTLDADFEEATEGEEVARRERLKTQWAQLEVVVGTPARLGLIARDIVDHFEKRLEVMDGKAMIVCMSRRICIDLYEEIVRPRPDWHADGDADGVCKVVMTGSASDPVEWQPHIRNKARREALAKRFRDADDPFRVVLVRDLWLTGFNAPSLHTMYIDKPMRDHGLMQTISRVNRVFKDKPGGLIVDYLGLAREMREAVKTYTDSGGKGEATLDKEQAVTAMQEKYEVCRGLFHGFDRTAWVSGTPAERLGLLPAAQEHILQQEDGKDRCLKAVRELSQAFALAVPHDDALAIRDEVAFFQAVRSVLAKRAASDGKPQEELDHAIRQIVSRAIASDEVLDIFSAAGLDKPDISILSDDFLAEVRDMAQRNLAVELLRKLLKGELAVRRRRNVVQARSFARMLEQTVHRYRNRAIEAAQVIEELIALAREMRAADARGAALNLSMDEIAFYDALSVNDSAVKVLGDEKLRDIARELVDTVRKNVTIDWTIRETVRVHLRRLVKRVLRQHGYPPDKQESAAQTVIEQAEVLSAGWAK